MSKKPNPQGKGLVPLLNELNLFSDSFIEAKNLQTIETDLFTSLFILESEMGIKPVVNKKYYLYKKNEGYKLSLISYKEWGKNFPYDSYVGVCELHRDLTWTLNLSEEIQKDKIEIEKINKIFQIQKEKISEVENLEDILPSYSEDYSFYQRALIWGLSKSLKISMIKSGLIEMDIKKKALKKGP